MKIEKFANNISCYGGLIRLVHNFFLKVNICVHKNQPNDPITRCKSSFNFNKDIDLKQELNFFEGNFEKDEAIEV